MPLEWVFNVKQNPKKKSENKLVGIGMKPKKGSVTRLM